MIWYFFWTFIRLISSRNLLEFNNKFKYNSHLIGFCKKFVGVEINSITNSDMHSHLIGFCKKFVGVEINSITNSDMHSHLIGFCKKFVGVEINSITNSDMHSHLIGKCWFTVNAEFLVGLSSPLLCSNTLDIE
ncbi:unnamed protein product [Rhizophagus irregularis]|uniref:Uncharacterized protein n=1 Tax=Rhizophagus irregularis TaxID=588596 RepID=A0A915Z2B5_9GLOM|nr:unnamed protein product [Rhizophagus irregularis]